MMKLHLSTLLGLLNDVHTLKLWAPSKLGYLLQSWPEHSGGGGGGTDLIKVLLEGHESEEDAGRKAANEF